MSGPEALFQQGLASHHASRFGEAIRLYQAVLSHQPSHIEARHLLGLASLQSGQPQICVDAVREAIALDPANAALHVTLGNAQNALRQANDALANHDRAIVLAPDFAWAWYNRANVLLNLGRHEESLASFDKAIVLRPDDAVSYCDRGNVLAAMNRPAEAVESYNRAIALKPDFAEAYCNRGNALAHLARYEEAIASYENSIALRPDHAQSYYNRGDALAASGDHEAALASFDIAINIDRNYADAHWNKGLCLLRMGRFEQGWQLFEWRKKLAVPVAARSYPRPLWTGQQDVAGKTLFLYAEQGFGDTIQFCRYAALAADAGARIILEVQNPLVELMTTLPGVSMVLSSGEQPPEFDLQCPLLSLPGAFDTTLETIPRNIPYLYADPGRTASWRDRLAHIDGFRVGLVWAGDPTAISVDRRRSLPLAALAPLASATSCRFVSLQLGPPAVEAAEPPPGMILHDMTDEIATFADTAALIANLDLVIGVDTSTPHLAAAMGKPVWLLNRFDTCWRWLLDRDDSPWYPTLRLFRQQRHGDWSHVIGRVARELRTLVRS